jgi:hypothetical protein
VKPVNVSGESVDRRQAMTRAVGLVVPGALALLTLLVLTARAEKLAGSNAAP